MKRFRRLPSSRRRLAIEAAALLPFAWLMVRTIPFRYWHTQLGKASSGEVDGAVRRDASRQHDGTTAKEISWAINAVNRRMGDAYTCLMKAMAAQWMLNRRHIASSLVLGTCTERGADGKLVIKAHAWLRVEGETVLGQHDGSFAAVSSYVKLPSLAQDKP